MRNKTSYAVVLGALFILGCTSDHVPNQLVQEPLLSGVNDDSFRAAASCPDCTIVNRSTVILPLTGKTFTEAKMWSDSSPGGRHIALDDRAAVVDAEALIRAEGALKIARQGKLRDDVYAISLTTSSELLPVWIWADYQDTPQPREALIANAGLRASVESKSLARLRTVTSKVTAWLDARGFTTYDRGTSDPSITADVPISALAELGKRDGVAIVGIRTPGAPTSTAWFNAVKGPAAQGLVSSAAGQSFCNTEAQQPDSYANLSVPSAQIFSSAGTTSNHMRWTAEIVAATAGSRMAPDATTYIANWDAGSVFSAWHWCFSAGIGSMNRSWRFDSYVAGGLGPTDMAQDYYAEHWPYPIITLAAGNCGDTCSTDCSTQTDRTVANRSHNVLVVGGSHDHGTNSTTDDTMAIFSAFANPLTTHSDFELPDLVAPAVGISSASIADFCGTSGAAPQVLGTALLMKARDWTFTYWPEMMRASIMATAVKGVDNGTRTIQLGAVGDLKQGAGLLNSLRAVNLADPPNYVAPNGTAVQMGRYAKLYSFATDFTNNLSNDTYAISASFTGRLRAVIAWDAIASGCSSIDASGCTGDTLEADLDLHLQKWSGTSWTTVCVSSSWDSSWELCDVAVTSGESYRIQMQKFATPATSTYVGVAWYMYDPAND